MSSNLPFNGLRMDEETLAEALLDQNECINATFSVLAGGEVLQLGEEVNQLVGELLFSQGGLVIQGFKWLLGGVVVHLGQWLVMVWRVSDDPGLGLEEAGTRLFH